MNNAIFFYHLFNQLLISLKTHAYLFYSMACNSILSLFLLFLKLFQFWPLGAPSAGPSVSLTYYHQLNFFLRTSFLALQDTPGSSFTLLAPILKSAISPRSPVSFCRRVVFKPNLDVGFAHCH